MANKMIKYPSTRQTEDDDAVQTELTLDFTGLTPEDIQEIAAQSAVIKWQGNIRKAKGGVPNKATYIVPKPGTRGAQPISEEAALRLLLEKYGSKEAVLEMLQGKE